MICFKHFKILNAFAKCLTLRFKKRKQKFIICRKPVLIRDHRYVNDTKFKKMSLGKRVMRF